MGIDTLSIANRLKAAERDGRVAEEIALLFREVDEERFRHLATREDLERTVAVVRADLERELALVRADLERGLAEVRAESRAEFEKMRLEFEKVRLEVKVAVAELKHDLTLRLGAMIAAAVAVLGGLNVFF
jgi:vacuolar-type H+-ATPase subunit C/Vma6